MNPVDSTTTTANNIFCRKCFAHFRSENVLKNHQDICGKHTHTKVFPRNDETLHFKNHEYKYKRIFTGYADFESVLQDSENSLKCPQCVNIFDVSEEYECQHSFTINTKDHRAICVSFIIIDRYGELVHEFCYTGNDAVEKFIKNVLICEEILINTIKFNQYMIFSVEEKKQFENSSVCYICNNNRGFKNKEEKPFTDNDPKVRDHDHLTGR